MKYLIAGLGNIGSEYENTRHNIGFDVLNVLAKEFDAKFETKRLASVASFRYKSRTFVLIKPTTYMNLSGRSIGWNNNFGSTKHKKHIQYIFAGS